MCFNESAAIFPTGTLKDMVAREYEAHCELLCFGSYPKWHEVEGCFETIRAKL